MKQGFVNRFISPEFHKHQGDADEQEQRTHHQYQWIRFMRRVGHGGCSHVDFVPCPVQLANSMMII